MKILIVSNSKIPAIDYGGAERVIWYLGKELTRLGHTVSYLVKEGSFCDFAKVYFLNKKKPIAQQMPADIDVVHFNSAIEETDKPYIATKHDNNTSLLDVNTVFISKNHAQRFGSDCYIYNGLDWDDYGKVTLTNNRNYFHFLGDASWRVKNVKGAIDVALFTPNEQLYVLGGTRLNFRMGFRFTISPRIKFFGRVGGSQKNQLLQGSKGFIFPVRWHEPFGLAITESLYFGCPVFATPHGSLPEIVINDVGFLSPKAHELADAIHDINIYSRQRCHEYASDCFNSRKMALQYLKKYELVLAGKQLNVVKPQLQQVQKEKFLDWED